MNNQEFLPLKRHLLFNQYEYGENYPKAPRHAHVSSHSRLAWSVLNICILVATVKPLAIAYFEVVNFKMHCSSPRFSVTKAILSPLILEPLTGAPLSESGTRNWTSWHYSDSCVINYQCSFLLNCEKFNYQVRRVKLCSSIHVECPYTTELGKHSSNHVYNYASHVYNISNSLTWKVENCSLGWMNKLGCKWTDIWNKNRNKIWKKMLELIM